MTVGIVLSSLGGVVAAIGFIAVIIRGIFKQVNATEDNTIELAKINGTLSTVSSQLVTLERRLSLAEDRLQRYGNP